jgi:5'-phosphate synthase pdxT subunit
MRIGVLALQGAVSEHVAHLKGAMRKLGASAGNGEGGKTGKGEVVEVRTRGELEELDGIVLPGGESTTLSLLMEKEGLFDGIAKVPKIFGTCAGAILLAKEVGGRKNGQRSLGLMDISVLRNGYGRQLESFEGRIGVSLGGGGDKAVEEMDAVFIRAPLIEKVGEGVEVLAECGGKPVAVRQGNYLATTFHPELSGSSVFHEYFLKM